MTLRSFLACAIVYCAFVAFSQCAKADPGIRLEVEAIPPAKGAKITDSVEVISVLDNQNGTSTTDLLACGTELKITLKNKDMDTEAKQRAVGQAILAIINQYCVKYD